MTKMRTLAIFSGVLCVASLCSGTSPLTSYANFWEEELEPVRPGHEEEEFLAVKEYESFISMSVNPGCKYRNCTLPTGPTVSLVNLTVTDKPVQGVEHHWLWSVIGHPTLQAAITRPGDRVKINWSSIFGFDPLDNSINYERGPIYSGALMLLNLVEYNDTNNTGLLSDDKREQIVFPLINFAWERKVVENTTKRISMQFVAQNYTCNATNNTLSGTINITISGYADDGYGSWLPHLCHSQRTNQMDIQLDRLVSNSGFNQSRFALQFVVVSDTDVVQSNVTWQTTTTLDDEHTPGIFKTEELVIPGKNHSLQSYLQWRPVVYTTTTRDLSESTGVFVGTPEDLVNPVGHLNRTLLYALYGEDLNYMLVKVFNVSLGSNGDGFYKKTKYQAWTFTYGVGKPIRNGFSPIVILAMTIMIALLLLVLITAGIICGVKKWKMRQTAGAVIAGQPPYQRLQQ